MLMIRLQRVGKKHDPSFRIVLVDSRRGPKSGNFIKILGSYNAQKGEPQFKEDEIKKQIAIGAQVSDTVHNLLVKAGIIKGKTKDVSAKSKKSGDEAQEEKTSKEETKSAEEDKSKDEAPAETPTEETPKEPSDKAQGKEEKEGASAEKQKEETPAPEEPKKEKSAE